MSKRSSDAVSNTAGAAKAPPVSFTYRFCRIPMVMKEHIVVGREKPPQSAVFPDGLELT
jgi:hypothetical protein